MNRKKRVVFVGKSSHVTDTVHEKSYNNESFVNLVHDYLSTAYPYSHIEVINKCNHDESLTDMALRWEQDVLTLQPEILSLSISTQDIKDLQMEFDVGKVQQIYENLLFQAREKTGSNIILIQPPLVYEHFNGSELERNMQYINAIGAVAEALGVVIIRTHEVFKNHKEAGIQLTTDGKSLNANGSMLMARTWIKTLETISTPSYQNAFRNISI
ncbi:hypothetical protein QA612_15955 [Evansella sp. AB-P1]|uniref:GDSL-type esterase/lipase family protein n=1 Tax=Evansella sp. AB-P1 TaxID=3037653 RepID=UPI00241F510D|nr:GDSL-type esterase/lipase family protein [Evansella sp. AB-P1]MDG5788951.1 hypothetical protein [Evansella sp. AB-P1]